MDENNREGITLGMLLQSLWKNIFIIIPITLVITILGIICATVIVKPKYKSTGSVIVSSTSTGSNINEAINNANYSIKMLSSISDIMLSDKVLDNVIKNNNELKGYTATSLRGTLTTSYDNSSNGSLTITLTCKAKSKDDAKLICSKVIEETSSVNDEMNYFPCKINILDEPKDGSYASPNKKLFTLIAFVIGIVLSFIVVFFKEFIFDNKVKYPNDLNHLSMDEYEIFKEYKILAKIPYIKEDK